MDKLSRREFIRTTALGLSALALDPLLAACSQAIPTETITLPPTQPQPVEVKPTSAAPTQATTPTSNASKPAGAPDLVVARGGEPEEMVRRSLAALGGMERFVPKNARVVVKPNICVAYHTYEYAVTTNPWVVGALVKLALEAGASRVQVMDNPFGGTAQEAYARSGIEEQVKIAGGEMMLMSGFKFVKTDIPLGKDLKSITAFQDILDADVLIDVPIAKHHGMAGLTLGMKNLMGAIEHRTTIHMNLGERIADLASLFRPALTVVDAVRILMANGPTGGDLSDVKKLDTVIASPDIVAADSYATTLFGLQPENIPYISPAVAMGLGRSDLGNLRIEEIQAGG